MHIGENTRMIECPAPADVGVQPLRDETDWTDTFPEPVEPEPAETGREKVPVSTG